MKRMAPADVGYFFALIFGCIPPKRIGGVGLCGAVGRHLPKGGDIRPSADPLLSLTQRDRQAVTQRNVLHFSNLFTSVVSHRFKNPEQI